MCIISYIDNDSLEEHFVTVKEQGGGKLISEGPNKAGAVHLVGVSAKDVPSLYRIELQVTKGAGKLAFDYFKANITRILGASRVLEHDFHLHLADLQNGGPIKSLALPTQYGRLCLWHHGEANTGTIRCAWGYMSLGGSVNSVESLAECLQVKFDAGGKRVALRLPVPLIFLLCQGNCLLNSRPVFMRIRWMRFLRHWG